MKIYYIYTALVTKGGADRVIADKANWLSEHGHEIGIVTDTQLGREPAFPLSPKVNLIDLAIDFSKEYGHCFPVRIWMYYKLMYQYRKKMQTLLMNDRPDIVITTLGRDISFITKIKDGSRKIGEAHTTKQFIRNFHLLEKKNILLKYLTKYFRWKMDRQVSKLDALVLLTQEHKCDWGEIVPTYVIPNSFPFYPDEISSCENKQAIIVGRYNNAKGYKYLLEAWKLVHAKHPDWIINAYGSGEYEDLIRQKIVDYHLEDSFVLNNPTDCIVEAYQQSSIYVMSSRYEGFPMVLLEAMACGLPCVSFDCPYGPRNIITDGEDGILVNYLDYRALSDSICRLIDDFELRRQMGKNGRKNVLRFSREHIMAQWIELFEFIIRVK